ncbi:MAG: pitrilysin family protein, partial [Gammaproteobacteria bacterium]
MLRTTELENGVTIATYTLPQMCSAAVGLWLVSGSRHQDPDTDGYAHLMEHLLFKGTAALDVRALASRFEAMGGQINAQTGRELTTLYGLVPGDQAGALAGLFVDMVLHPRFDDRDLELEREVVLSEMAQVAENPEERIDEEAVAAAWPGHPMGRPILGSAAVLR